MSLKRTTSEIAVAKHSTPMVSAVSVRSLEDLACTITPIALARENSSLNIEKETSTPNYVQVTDLVEDNGTDNGYSSIQNGDENLLGNDVNLCFSFGDAMTFAQRRRRALCASLKWDWNDLLLHNPLWNVMNWLELSDEAQTYDNMINFDTKDDEEVEHCIVMLSPADVKHIIEIDDDQQDTDCRNNNADCSNIPAMPSCPITVQWLMDNFETAEGVSLPRSTLYYHYLAHCAGYKLDPVNAASFGKLIRSVFLGLKTRRLGTRGNSKYHYYGIRLKPTSMLNNFEEPPDHQITNGHSNVKVNMIGSRQRAYAQKKTKARKIDIPNLNELPADEIAMLKEYLGDSSHAFDNFPNLDFSIQVPEGLAVGDLVMFRESYRDHCKEILEDIMNFQLDNIEKRWRNFWAAGVAGTFEQEMDIVLARSKLEKLCSIKEVRQFIQDCDYHLFQSIVRVLLPDVLRPTPSPLTQAIRNFGKNLERNLYSSMSEFSPEIIGAKMKAAKALAQTLRRYTALNHLAQTARAVLQNQAQISQMISDLNHVDFRDVQEQVALICGSNGNVEPDLEAEFKATFSQDQTVEQLAKWLEGVVDRVLHSYFTTEDCLKASSSFLLKWSFYSSLVIRDLTFSSAASFGSFHLLRLLFDEYMFYLLEKKIAEVTGIMPIAIIGQVQKPLDNSPSSAKAFSLDEQESQKRFSLDEQESQKSFSLDEQESQKRFISYNPETFRSNALTNSASVEEEATSPKSQPDLKKRKRQLQFN